MVTMNACQTAKTQFVEGDGIRYAYRVVGDASSPPLIFCHRFRGNMDDWDPLFVNTIAEKRQVILFDNAGIGLSSGQPESTVQGMAKHAANVIRLLGFKQVDALGFSMGGYVAREIVRLAPGRVQSLALVATSSRADLPLQAEQRRKAARANPIGAFRGLGRAAIAQSLHPDNAANEALVAHVRIMGERLGREVFVRQSLIVRDADTGRLSDIQCPTLVVAAAEDQLRSAAEARELAEGIAGARLVTVPNAGHLIPLEQPQALASAIAAIVR